MGYCLETNPATALIMVAPVCHVLRDLDMRPAGVQQTARPLSSLLRLGLQAFCACARVDTRLLSD